MKIKIYIFGNSLLEFDSLPIRLQPALQEQFPEISFEVIDPNENLHPEHGQLIIIDTVINIEQPVLIDDMDQLELSPRYSMHDLDLAFTLKLLKKLGDLEKAYIIGLPPDLNEAAGLVRVAEFIKKIKGSC